MAQDIKQKITLEGEREYNAALKEAQRHLKTLRSELKAETAELGKNASEQDKNRVKSQSLQKQIKEQEKVVKTLKEALEKAKQEYGDNEEVVAKWEMKLNDARTSLANMRNDLDGLATDLQTVNTVTAEGVTATKSFADAINAIGGAGGNIASAIEGTFTGVVDIIKDAFSELWGLIAETAARANEWTDIAAIWNTDPAKIEKYARGVEYAGKSFSDLSAAVSKIVSGDTDKIFELTGTRMLGDGDEWQYAMDVLSAISGMEYQQKLNTLQEIFGDKRASGVMDLVNAWGTILEGGDKLTQNGYGLGDEALERMNTVQEKIEGIEASWNALKENIAGRLGEATIPILMDVQGGLDGIAEYLNASDDAERQAAKEKIEENITKFCKDVAAMIKAGLEIIGEVGKDLEGSDNVIEQVIGKGLLALKETIEFLSDENNWNAIKIALEGFFGLWLAGKGAQALSAIATLAANIKTITAFNALSSLTKGFGGGGTTAGANAGAGASGGGGLLASVGAKIGGGVLAGLAVLFENAIKHQGNDDIFTEEELADYELRNADEIAYQRKRGAWKRTVEEAGVVSDDLQTVDVAGALRDAAEEFWDIYRKDPEGDWDDAWDKFEAAFEGQDELFDELNKMMELFQQSQGDDSWRGVENLPDWMFSDWAPGSTGASEVVSGMKGLPGQISAAARAGTAQGISGIRVYMDGVAVGHLVAPTVSRDIAAAI